MRDFYITSKLIRIFLPFIIIFCVINFVGKAIVNVVGANNINNIFSKIESAVENQENKKVVDKKIKGILEDAKPGRKTKGKTTQYEKEGGFEEANEDFGKLNPKDVKDIDADSGKVKTGKLDDGRSVTVRQGSKDGRPTLEIRKPNGRGIEIRYGNKEEY